MSCWSILGWSRLKPKPFLVINRFLKLPEIQFLEGFVSLAGGQTEDSEENSLGQQRISSTEMKSQRVIEEHFAAPNSAEANVVLCHLRPTSVERVFCTRTYQKGINRNTFNRFSSLNTSTAN